MSYHTDQGMVAQASQGHCRPQDPIINYSWGFAIHYLILGFSFLRIISCFLLHTSNFWEWQGITHYCSVIPLKLSKGHFSTQDKCTELLRFHADDGMATRDKSWPPADTWIQALIPSLFPPIHHSRWSRTINCHPVNWNPHWTHSDLHRTIGERT